MIINAASLRLIILITIAILLFIWNFSFGFNIGLPLSLLWLACIGGISIEYCKTGLLNALSLKNYFLLQFLLIHCIGFYCFCLRKDLGLANYYHSDQEVTYALWISIVGILTFHVFEKIGSKCQVKQICIEYSYTHLYSSKGQKWLLLITFSILVWLLFWLAIGGIPLTISGYHGEVRTNVGKGLGFLEAFASSIQNCIFLLIITSLLPKKIVKSDFLIGCFVLCLLNLLNNNRSSLVFSIVNIAVAYTYMKMKFNLKQVLISVVFIVILAGGIGAFRNGRINLLSIGSSIATEANVEFDNYVETFNMFRGRPFLYGSTLFPIITVPIPRSILPNKDEFLTAGMYFKEEHGHSHIRVGERLSFIGELYMNYGVPGVVVGMSFIGLFMGILLNKFTPSNIWSVYFYVQTTSFFVGLVAGDIVTIVISFFMANIVPVTFLILTKAVFINCHAKKNYNRNNLLA